MRFLLTTSRNIETGILQGHCTCGEMFLLPLEEMIAKGNIAQEAFVQALYTAHLVESHQDEPGVLTVKRADV